MKKVLFFAIPMALVTITSCDSISDKIAEKATETVLESLAGDSVNIDISGEDGNLNVTIQNEDGVTTLDVNNTKLPNDFPSDIYITPNSKRGLVSVIDSPDGKFVVFQDTIYSTLSEAQADIKNNMKGYNIELETTSDVNATFMFKKEGVKTFTLALNEYEGVVLANYGVMY